MKLVIVESPTKAKTISKFLGKGFRVTSSYGHVRDLPKNETGIDVEKDFAPRYIIPQKARTKVAELKKDAMRADEIILATDEDREGEAIAWHLVEALGLNDVKSQKSQPKAGPPLAEKVKSFRRIVFHEITKTAIEKALASPREIDLQLVDAQQARRVLDRLVGYELSPFLWKKIKRGLSAGRVQSVALRLIVEREKEISNFKNEEYFTISARLKKDKGEEIFEAALLEKNGKKIEILEILKLFAGDYKTSKSILTDQKSADEITSDLEKAAFQITTLEEKETLRTPPPPFTTSTLQQSAINKLGFSAKMTMSVAQKLYEKGFITYMRTDSTNLSLESLIAAQKTITKIFGKVYALKSPRYYKTKSKSAQEAHEAIRPTDPAQSPDELENNLEPAELRLYKLIWRRMLACQMQPAKFNSVKADILAVSEKNKYRLSATGSTLKFDGYLKAYGGKTLEKLLPPLAKDEKLTCEKVEAAKKTTAPPPRYSEASLVKALEEYGIGRPSTYAPTIATIIDRNYVEKNEEKRLQPQEIGTLVSDVLSEHFANIVDLNFTAQIEEDFDEIAEGKEQWVPVIRRFYEPFHENLEDKLEKVRKRDILEKLDRQCPQCGGDLLVRFGRFGKFIACSKFPDCKYTEKTEEEKQIQEENSGEICDQCGAPMVVKRGKYGMFLGCSRYPDCKGIKKIEKTLGIKCPKCETGDVVERRSKRGKLFWGCSRYPKCDFGLWNKPTGEKCPKCESLMVFGMKGQVFCSNKECGKK
jgi:DNA topoisomerase I